RIPDRRISRGTRPGRHDRASQKNARTNQPVARLFLFGVVNVRGASLARRGPGNRGTKEAMPRPPLSYKEALGWLYSLQRFGIKLRFENIRPLIHELPGDLWRQSVTS